jgi:serine/threonine protein kinase
VVDYDDDPLPWIAMEYMDGGHLGERVDEMGISQSLWTAISVTKAVRHAHLRGVAHFDLKPANILFRSMDDGWDVPKVADWGLSKHLLDHSHTVEGLSPQYAAPEQFDDEYGATDNLTDIYQLGSVFYELFTGQPPFVGKSHKLMRKIQEETPTPPSEIADVPEKLDEILLSALAKQKEDRYEDIVFFRDDLVDLFDTIWDEKVSSKRIRSRDIPVEDSTEVKFMAADILKQLPETVETAEEFDDAVRIILESIPHNIKKTKQISIISEILSELLSKWTTVTPSEIERKLEVLHIEFEATIKDATRSVINNYRDENGLDGSIPLEKNT